VLETIRTRLLEAGAEQTIRQAILKARRKDKTQSSREERQLADLRKKIERGTENLALAAAEDFSAISRLLTQWRDRETQLSERIEQRNRDLEPLPEALSVIARINDIPSNLTKADKAKLAHAIRQTVASITIGTGPARTGKVEYKEMFGELQFHSAFGIDPIRIPDEAIGQRRIWRELGELVRNADRPLYLKDFAIQIGTKDLSRAAHNVRRAEAAGLIRKIGHQGGWVMLE